MPGRACWWGTKAERAGLEEGKDRASERKSGEGEGGREGEGEGEGEGRERGEREGAGRENRWGRESAKTAKHVGAAMQKAHNPHTNVTDAARKHNKKHCSILLQKLRIHTYSPYMQSFL